MLGIFNSVIRTSTGLKDWDAPDHWRRQDMRSTYDRQDATARKYRDALEQDLRHRR